MLQASFPLAELPTKIPNHPTYRHCKDLKPGSKTQKGGRRKGTFRIINSAADAPEPRPHVRSFMTSPGLWASPSNRQDLHLIRLAHATGFPRAYPRPRSPVG